MRTLWIVSAVVALLGLGGGAYYYITMVNVKVEAPPPPQAEQKPRPDTFGDPNKSRHVQFPGQPASPSAPKQ